MARPIAIDTSENRGGDAVLFKHDIALHRWRGLIFAIFGDAVPARRAGAQDLEDHNRIGHHGTRIGNRGTDHEAVRVANAAGDFDLEVAAVELARSSAESGDESKSQIALNAGMSGGPADQGEGLEAVEFIA